MYSKVEEALLFAQKAHKGQKYKNSNIEKSFHSISVALTIKDITDVDDYVIAALLHNIIMATEYGYEEIEEQFGTLVADIVFDLSEDMGITKSFERKKEFIQKMKKINDVNVLNIIIADKMQHLLMFYEDYKKVGDKVWKSTGSNKDENSYVYKGAYYIAKSKGVNPTLLDRYKKLVVIYFGDVDEESI
ncbi:MAG: HD domain-containing protein [Bacilli bacterium]|nr:HD domain-containing protein [Bacilli bacterium]